MLINCQCLRCVKERTPVVNGVPVQATRMFFCDICGNKRCPRSDWHENECTGSNEPGQPGSRYA
jgi:hypothetical protein